MLSAEKNRLLTEVGPGTPMGGLLRRYWMPVAGVSEFDRRATKPIRLMGEDLVLYRDLQGRFGLVDRRCAHRRADLALGVVEDEGLRCQYHGWRFDAQGACVEQPFEDTTFAGEPQQCQRAGLRITAYPVQTKGGLVWAYLGPQPAPLLPDWEAFSWPNGFAQIVLSEIPCNWFQCQENSIDPVHFEWMHEYWARRVRRGDMTRGPRHLKVAFHEFEHGFTYRRTREDSDEQDEAWTIGRVCLWPNGFFLGEHFEWRVPIDDTHTLSVTWKWVRVPKGGEPYVQASIPTWDGPVLEDQGRWIDTHVMNQDFIAWVGQGPIADRTQEHLSASDRGIAAIRKRFFDDLDTLARGGEPKGLIRDAARNVRVPLPMMDRHLVVEGHTPEEIMAWGRLRAMYTTYVFQAGQPEWVRQQFADAMGLPMGEHDGLVASRNAPGMRPAEGARKPE
jgi:5,5'-dehydrodivanillate O-demethylase oxygenase subunit